METEDYRPLSIHKASAGSGKTYSLARDYITLLLGVPVKYQEPASGMILNSTELLPPGRPVEHNRHRKILAITFTNKATEEMKSRIIEELEKLARNYNDPDHKKHSDYTEHLEKTLKATPEQISRVAETAMVQILNDYGHFNVSTIDSFFQAVMRNMAYELDCPGDYEVTLDETAVLSESVGRMLDNINRPGQVDMWSNPLVRKIRDYMYVLRRNSDNVNLFNRDIKIFGKIVNFARNLFDEGYRYISKDFEDWMSNENHMSGFIAGISRLQSELIERAGNIGSALRDCIDLPPGPGLAAMKKNGMVYNTINKVCSGTISISVGISKAVNETAHLSKEAYLEEMEQSIPAADIMLKNKEMPYEVYRQVMLLLRELVACDVHLNVLHEVQKNIQTYELMYEIKGFVRRYVQENNLVILSDTSEVLYRMLGTDADQVPFMYEKMGMRLNHFLIDEFQDTSRMQWSTLEPLVSEGLSHDHHSLIIGDEKQSIYRFRNSDSELLHSIVPETYALCSHIHGADVSENTNHRSSHLVVQFNNTIFSRLAHKYGEDTYDNVVQTPSERKAKLPGYIKVVNLVDVPLTEAEMAEARLKSTAKNGKKKADDKVKTLRQRDKEEITESRKQLLVDNINRQSAAGYPYSEIAVLTYTNQECKEVVNILLNAGIPVVTDEAMQLDQSDAVNLVVSVMGLLMEPRTERNKKEKDITPEYGPRGHMSNAMLVNRFESIRNTLIMQGMDTTTANGQALVAALEKVEIKQMQSVFENLGISNAATLTTLAEAIICNYITEERRVAEAPFLSAFHDALADFVRTHGQNPVAFMRWWKAKGHNVSVSAAAGADAVKVMTIHKSKGLQFKCVHLPYMGESLYGSSVKSDTMWVVTPPQWSQYDFPPALRVTMNKVMGGYGSPLFAQYEQNRHERFLDGLNRVYVAFTRAENELFIYLCKSIDKEDSLSADMVEVMKEPYNAKAAYTTDTAPEVDKTGQATYGLPTIYIPEKDKEGTTEETLSLRGYRVSLGADAPKITNTVSALDVEAEIHDDEDTADAEPYSNAAIDRGLRIHRALERVHHLEDVAPVIRYALHRDTLQTDEGDAIRNFFKAPELQEKLTGWFRDFQHESNEVSIFDQDEKDAKNRNKRLDRLVFMPDGEIHILDYKTSADAPNPSLYTSTLAEYRRRVMVLYPHAHVRSFLLYIDSREIIEC